MSNETSTIIREQEIVEALAATGDPDPPRCPRDS